MLDLFILQGPRFAANGLLDYYPYVKATSRAVPLGTSSAHPAAVHRSWPVAEIARIRRLSSRQIAFEHYSARKKARWAEFFIRPVSPLSHREGGSLGTPGREDRDPSRCLRLVLRCHPSLTGLQAKLNEVCAAWHHVLKFAVPQTSRLHKPAVGIAWRAAARPLAMCLRSLKEEGEEEGG